MTSTLQKDKLIHILFLAAVIYCMVFALNYLDYPLARAPQLDARENLILAGKFSSGEEFDEPFYRAVLYPYLLSLLGPDPVRPVTGLVLGIICHLLNGFLVAKIAEWLWKSRACGSLAGFLYLLNPASLFYSVQLMDFTLGILLFLLACYAGLAGTRKRAFITSGIVLGLAVLTRPHFLPAALVLPFSIMLLRRDRIPRALLVYPGLVCVLLCQGLVNDSISGDFRILPWQGPYNLYAANRQGANGLYYKQVLDLSGTEFLNPTRAEAARLYGAETGQSPPFDITKMNRHWQGKSIQMIMEDPVRILKLWTFKFYATLNSYEQYNNLTFSFHKARLPMLRFNPLNWGILLILGSVGMAVLWTKRRSGSIAIASVILAYTASLILYYASAKFRLPLVPLLAIPAGGVALAGRIDRKHLLLFGIIAVSAAAITFSSLANIRSRDTYVQDKLLLANAHAELGEDYEAASLSRSVLWDYPGRREAQRIYTISYFNLHITGDPRVFHWGSWDDQKKWVQQTPPTDPVQDAILGVYFWKWKQKDSAVKIWSDSIEKNNEGSRLAQACLNAIGSKQESDALALAMKKILQPDA